MCTRLILYARVPAPSVLMFAARTIETEYLRNPFNVRDGHRARRAFVFARLDEGHSQTGWSLADR